MNKILSTLALVWLTFQSGWADSPLTSTNFHLAYMDVPIVKTAVENPKKLTEEQMEYLFNEANPLDIKLALINAIGWDADEPLSTRIDYMNYCALHLDRKKYNHPENKIVTHEDLLNYASPEQMAVLVYLQAMANYSDMAQAYTLAEIAMQNPVSTQSFMLPMALVWAQIKLIEGEWDDIYPSVEYLFLHAEEKDMRPEAVKIITDYISLYKE